MESPPHLGDPTQGEVDAELDRRTLEILTQQALDYNAGHAEYQIDIDSINTKLELAISLWQRGIDTLPIFGQPYDAQFKQTSNASFYTEQFPPNRNIVYLALDNPEICIGLLATSLRLPEENQRYSRNERQLHGIVLNKLKEILGQLNITRIADLNSYYQLRTILKTLNNVQLAYLLLACNREALIKPELGGVNNIFAPLFIKPYYLI